jgi:hypothetical protein
MSMANGDGRRCLDSCGGVGDPEAALHPRAVDHALLEAVPAATAAGAGGARRLPAARHGPAPALGIAPAQLAPGLDLVRFQRGILDGARSVVVVALFDPVLAGTPFPPRKCRRSGCVELGRTPLAGSKFFFFFFFKFFF